MTELERILYNIGNDLDLHEACQGLLRYFKLDYTEISPSILDASDFLDEKFVLSHSALLNKIEEVRIVGAATPNTFLQESISTITREELERSLADERYEDMIFISIDANAQMTRSEIAMLTRAFNRSFHYRPVVLFVRHGHLLSMTTCERSAYIRSGYKGEKVGKVTILYRINCNKPHAGHINILDSLDITGCTSFEAVYQKWLYTFSNELLTRKFYQELSDWYFWAVKEVRFPNKLDDPNDDGKYNYENVIRLVTRLIFVWFLKEKHLIPEEFFNQKFIAEHLIDGFAPNEQVTLFGKSTESKYYKAILQNLFFAMLNCPIVDEETGMATNRRFCDDGTDPDNAKLMRYKKYFINPQLFLDLANQKVPFLNGGLFDCLDNRKDDIYYDAFSDNEKISNALEVPDFLFFGEEAGKNIDLSEFYGDENKKKVSARGIIDILAKYKFTIEENTPYEQEVSLDPELLGKVFENLLAAFNPETKTTARKQTGSFYTPREIVQYMVDESLVEHLKRTVGTDLEPKFRELVSYTSNDVELTDEQKKDVMQSLYNCKILDPACGSGAFPVGMLQQMVHIISKVDPENKMWYDLIIDDATRQSRAAFETESDIERNEKLEDIKQSFDQSLNYPDYARKLYLIENCIYGGDLQPIAIQISKLRFFISLIVDQKENNDPTKNFGIRPLPNLEAKFVACNSLVPLEKNADLFTSSEDIVALEKRMHEANHKIFTAKSPQKKAAWRRILAESRELMAKTLMDNGFVSKSSSQMIASWNMFDQNSSADFFDSEWMFGITIGFDIVIGNPPYIQLEDDNGKLAKFYKPYSYETFATTGDIYCLFYEMGINALKEHGILCYITSNKWMRTKYGEKLRYYLVNNANPLLLIDFAGMKIFENATVETNILMLGREHNIVSTTCFEGKDKNITSLSLISEYVKNSSHKQLFSSSEKWIIYSETETSIREKINTYGVALKDKKKWRISINRGILTGLNDAFIIQTEIRDNIINSCESENEKIATEDIIRPIIRGRDIQRYKYQWDGLWIINTHNGLRRELAPINIDDFPSIKRHLDKYWDRLEARADQGNTPYNLRNCAYLNELKKPKIIWKRIGSILRFCFDDNQAIALDSTCFATGEHLEYLCCLFNSKMGHYLLKDSPKTGTGDLLISVQAVDPIKVPIPTIDDDKTFKAFLERQHKEYSIETENEINKKIYELYHLTPEEIKFIESTDC